VKLKLLASVALAASLATSASADLTGKKVEPKDVEVKEIESQEDLEHLFDQETVRVYRYGRPGTVTTFTQQSRIEQKGNRNDAYVDQVYSDEGLAQIRQTEGNRNYASVSQSDYGNTAAPFRNATNIAVVDQVGSANNATSYQSYVNAFDPTNLVEIHQKSDRRTSNADGNYADAYQAGAGNSILINQDASEYTSARRNSATATQYGDNQTSTIDQRGDNNIANSYQDNAYGGNVSVISQIGDGYGAANAAYTTQTGEDNEALISQNGNGNWAEILQTSNENVAQIFQDGTDNEAYASQEYGNLNAVLIVQHGTGNYASSAQ